MNVSHTIRVLILALFLLPLAACSGNSDTAQDRAAFGLAQASAKIQAASEKIREEIATGDIDLSSDDANAPAAVITPDGELVIDGRKVATNAAQHALLVEYRQQVAEIAQAGAEIGLQGAGVAMAAMGETLKGVFSGASEADIKSAVESQASGLKDEAVKLCDLLPPLLATQGKLAAVLPEFRPYANADADDIANCRSDIRGASVTSD